MNALEFSNIKRKSILAPLLMILKCDLWLQPPIHDMESFVSINPLNVTFEHFVFLQINQTWQYRMVFSKGNSIRNILIHHVNSISCIEWRCILFGIIWNKFTGCNAIDSNVDIIINYARVTFDQYQFVSTCLKAFLVNSATFQNVENISMRLYRHKNDLDWPGRPERRTGNFAFSFDYISYAISVFAWWMNRNSAFI